MKKKVSLTSSWNPGDRDQGKTYSEVRIMKIELNFEQKEVVFEVEYGNEVDGQWQKGAASPRRSECLVDDDYTTVLAISCGEGDNCVEKLEKHFLQLLVTRGVLSGTVS